MAEVGRVVVSWARRASVRAGSAQEAAAVRPSMVSRGVGWSVRRAPRAPSAAWAGVTPRVPATVSMAAVAGVQWRRQRVPRVSVPPAPVVATGSA